MKWFRNLIEKLRELINGKFEDYPVPEWPEPYRMKDIYEGKDVEISFGSDFIDDRYENRIFFDIDATDEMNYSKGYRKVLINGLEHVSGDVIKMNNKTIYAILKGLNIGRHAFRMDIVSYEPCGKNVKHKHVRTIYDINIIERQKPDYSRQDNQENLIVDVQVTKDDGKKKKK